MSKKVKCSKCGTEFTTRAKELRCPNCRSRKCDLLEVVESIDKDEPINSIEVNPVSDEVTAVNNESEPELKGTPIVSAAKSLHKSAQEKVDKENRVITLVNIGFGIVAIVALGIGIYNLF